MESPTSPKTTERTVLMRPFPGKPRSKLPPTPKPLFCACAGKVYAAEKKKKNEMFQFLKASYNPEIECFGMN